MNHFAIRWFLRLVPLLAVGLLSFSLGRTYQARAYLEVVQDWQKMSRDWETLSRVNARTARECLDALHAKIIHDNGEDEPEEEQPLPPRKRNPQI